MKKRILLLIFTLIILIFLINNVVGLSIIDNDPESYKKSNFKSKEGNAYDRLNWFYEQRQQGSPDGKLPAGYFL